LGIAPDVEAMVQNALRQGRSLDRMGAVLRGEGRIDIPPILEVDTALAEAHLGVLAARFDVPTKDAGVRVARGRVEAIPATAGRALDVAATVAWLERNIAQVVSEGRLDLTMVPVRPASIDVSALVAQANQWLSDPLSVRAYDPISDEALTWLVVPEVWSTWLSLSIDPRSPTQPRWELDAGKARAYLSTQAEALNPDRYLDWAEVTAALENAVTAQGWHVPARVYHRERQHVVQPSETLASIARDYGMPYPWVQQANPGIGDALQPGQVLTIPSPDVLLPLPVVENKRIVVSISQQAMWTLEHGVVKWIWPVSTGIGSSPTSPGVFQVQSHDPNAYANSWDLWMPYFMGIYRPVPTSHFMNGFHGFPTRDGVNLLWTGALGRPVTFGCILLTTANAAVLYEWAEEGVLVEIQH
jgi:LysM repeat protein